MSTLAQGAPAARILSNLPLAWLAELERRQPQLANVGHLMLVATLPLLLAMTIDARLVNGIGIWVKPVKFLVSLTVYYWTLAWFFGYLPRRAQRTRLGRFVIYAPILAGILEMIWLIGTAAAGQPAHFNRSAPIYSISYSLAGALAAMLLVALLVQGLMIARDREIKLAPAFRLSLVLGAVVASVATLGVAGYLASGAGHWVGGVPSDAGGLPILGWSRSGGDLRVAHFWALHASQLLPLAGWDHQPRAGFAQAARSGLGRGSRLRGPGRIHVRAGARGAALSPLARVAAKVRRFAHSAGAVSKSVARALRRAGTARLRAAPSAQRVAVDHVAIESQAQPGRRRHSQLAVHRPRHFLEQLQRPRHVFDGEAVGDRRDEMHVDLGEQVAHDRQVEGFGHAGDLHPVGDPAHPQQVDHHDVDRARFEHVAERARCRRRIRRRRRASASASATRASPG